MLAQNKCGMLAQNKCGMLAQNKCGMLAQNKCGMLAQNKCGMLAQQLPLEMIKHNSLLKVCHINAKQAHRGMYIICIAENVLFKGQEHLFYTLLNKNCNTFYYMAAKFDQHEARIYFPEVLSKHHS